jgi:hypothetical protein
LSALRAAVKTSGDDELSLLFAVGGDTVGTSRSFPKAPTCSSRMSPEPSTGSAAARRSGLPTVDAKIVRDRDGALGLVGRFDRLPDGTMLA